MPPVQDPVQTQTSNTEAPAPSTAAALPAVPGVPSERVREDGDGRVLVMPWTTDRSAALRVTQLKHQLDLLNFELSTNSAKEITATTQTQFEAANVSGQESMVRGNMGTLEQLAKDEASARYLVDNIVPLDASYYLKALPGLSYAFPGEYASVRDSIHARQVEILKENALKLKLIAGTKPIHKASVEMAEQAEKFLAEAQSVESPQERLRLHNKAILSFAFAVQELTKASEIDITKEQKDWETAHKDAHRKLDDAMRSLDRAETTLRVGVKVVVIAGAIYVTAQTAGAGSPLLLAAVYGTGAGTAIGASAEFGEAAGMYARGLPNQRDHISATLGHSKDAFLYSLGYAGSIKYARYLESALKYKEITSLAPGAKETFAAGARSYVHGWSVAGRQAAITELPAAAVDTAYEKYNGDLPPGFFPVMGRFGSRVGMAGLSGGLGFQGAFYRQGAISYLAKGGVPNTVWSQTIKPGMFWSGRAAVSLPAEAYADGVASYLGMEFEAAMLGRPLTEQEKEDLIISSVVGWGVGNVAGAQQARMEHAMKAQLDQIARERNELLQKKHQEMGLVVPVEYVGVLSPRTKTVIEVPAIEPSTISVLHPDGTSSHYIVEHLGHRSDTMSRRLAATDHDVLSRDAAIVDSANGGLLGDSLIPYQREVDGTFLTKEMESPLLDISGGRQRIRKHVSAELERVAHSVSRVGDTADPNYGTKLQDRVKTFISDAAQRLRLSSYRAGEPEAGVVKTDLSKSAVRDWLGGVYEHRLKPFYEHYIKATHDYLYKDSWVRWPYSKAVDFAYATGSFLYGLAYVPTRWLGSQFGAGYARVSDGYQAWRDMPWLGLPPRVGEGTFKFAFDTSAQAVGGVLGVLASMPNAVPYISLRTPFDVIAPFGGSGQAVLRSTFGLLYDVVFPANSRQFAEKLGMFHEGSFLLKEAQKRLPQLEAELAIAKRLADSSSDKAVKERAAKLDAEVKAFREDIATLSKQVSKCDYWAQRANFRWKGNYLTAGALNELNSTFARVVEHASKYDERIMLRALHDTLVRQATDPRGKLDEFQQHILLMHEKLSPEAKQLIRDAALKAGRAEVARLGSDPADWRVKNLNEKLDFLENFKPERATPTAYAKLRDPHLSLADVYQSWVSRELRGNLMGHLDAVKADPAADHSAALATFSQELAMLDRTLGGRERDNAGKGLERRILGERRLEQLIAAGPGTGNFPELELTLRQAAGKGPKAKPAQNRLKSFLALAGEPKEVLARIEAGDFRDVRTILARLSSSDPDIQLQAREGVRRFVESAGVHDATTLKAKQDQYTPFLERVDAVREIEGRLIELLEKSPADELQARLQNMLDEAGKVIGPERRLELVSMLQRRNHETVSRGTDGKIMRIVQAPGVDIPEFAALIHQARSGTGGAEAKLEKFIEVVMPNSDAKAREAALKKYIDSYGSNFPELQALLKRARGEDSSPTELVARAKAGDKEARTEIEAALKNLLPDAPKTERDGKLKSYLDSNGTDFQELTLTLEVAQRAAHEQVKTALGKLFKAGDNHVDAFIKPGKASVPEIDTLVATARSSRTAKEGAKVAVGEIRTFLAGNPELAKIILEIQQGKSAGKSYVLEYIDAIVPTANKKKKQEIYDTLIKTHGAEFPELDLVIAKARDASNPTAQAEARASLRLALERLGKPVKETDVDGFLTKGTALEPGVAERIERLEITLKRQTTRETEAIAQLKKLLAEVIPQSAPDWFKNIDLINQRIEEVISRQRETFPELEAIAQRINSDQFDTKARSDAIKLLENFLRRCNKELDPKMQDAELRRAVLERQRLNARLTGESRTGNDLTPWSLARPLIVTTGPSADMSSLVVPPSQIYKAKASSAKIELMRDNVPFLFGKD